MSTRRIDPRIPVIAIGCALLLTGIVAGSAGAQAKPCALLTPAQILTAVGDTVGDGQPNASTGCMWQGKAKGGAAPVRVTLSLLSGVDYAQMAAPLPGITKTEASGIGDAAFYTKVGPLTTLTVKQGATTFVVRLYGVAGQAKQEAAEKAIALDVAAKT